MATADAIGGDWVHMALMVVRIPEESQLWAWAREIAPPFAERTDRPVVASRCTERRRRPLRQSLPSMNSDARLPGLFLVG